MAEVTGISHSFGGGKFKFKVPADSVPGENSLHGGQIAVFFLPVLLWSKVSSGASSYSYEGTNPFKEPHPENLIEPWLRAQSFISEYSHSQDRASTYELGGKKIAQTLSP